MDYFSRKSLSKYLMINIELNKHDVDIFINGTWQKKVWVLIYNMFIFEKVGHSKFVEMHGDTSDYFRSASKSDRYFFLLIAIYL
jgi:hypothetical protein